MQVVVLWRREMQVVVAVWGMVKGIVVEMASLEGWLQMNVIYYYCWIHTETKKPTCNHNSMEVLNQLWSKALDGGRGTYNLALLLKECHRKFNEP